MKKNILSILIGIFALLNIVSIKAMNACPLCELTYENATIHFNDACSIIKENERNTYNLIAWDRLINIEKHLQSPLPINKKQTLVIKNLCEIANNPYSKKPLIDSALAIYYQHFVLKNNQ